MVEPISRIWFDPPEFWAATQSMTVQQRDELFQTIWQLAEKQEVDSLRKYHFVKVGPYPKCRSTERRS